MNLEAYARDAVAGNDDDIGLDTLKCVRNDLTTLYCALTNERSPVATEVAAEVVAQITHRIDLALVLAHRDRVENESLEEAVAREERREKRAGAQGGVS